MRKRIYLSIMAMTVLCLLVLSILLCFVFYHQLSTTIRAELRQHAEIFSDNTSETTLEALAGPSSPDIRISLVAPDGTVVYDSISIARTMPNHLEREEIFEAIENGYGESKRFSETLNEETYYYAVLLTDGYILRLSKTTSSIWGVFGASLPIVAGVVASVIIIGYLFAGNLTKRIVEPINKVKPDTELVSPYDELVPFIKTISQQKEHIHSQMHQLKERTDTIEAIMDSMSEGIIIANQKGIVLSINKSASAIFEISGSLSGKNMLEIFRDVDLIENMRNAIGGIRGEITIEHSGETYRVYFSPVTHSGAIILFLNITDKIQAELLRREFSANVSHELKTPLTTIYGNAEMLYSGMVKPEDTQNFYKKIQDESSRLISLINDIILLSRLDESAGGDMLLANVELNAVVAECIESLSYKIQTKNIQIISPEEKTFIKASRSQMYELFYNLIENAIKYNKYGGTVDIEFMKNASQVSISISDTGTGIPQEAQERVFERFYRVDKSRSKTTGGTGLGLAIVKHIVLAYKGKIDLNSRENKGTTIQIQLTEPKVIL